MAKSMDFRQLRLWSNYPTLLVQKSLLISALIDKNKEVIGKDNDVESTIAQFTRCKITQCYFLTL